MDGTIYLDNDLFDGTIDFLEYVKSIGGRYIFVTNNSSKSVDKYIEKLASLGIESVEEDFLTSTNATVLHLQKKNFHKIYAFGTTSFKEQLKKGDFPSPTSWRTISTVCVWDSILSLTSRSWRMPAFC